MRRRNQRALVEIEGEHLYPDLKKNAKHIAAIQRRPVKLSRYSDKPWSHMTRLVWLGVDEFFFEARDPKTRLWVSWQWRVWKDDPEDAGMSQVIAGMAEAPPRLRRQFVKLLVQFRTEAIEDLERRRRKITYGERAIEKFNETLTTLTGSLAKTTTKA